MSVLLGDCYAVRFTTCTAVNILEKKAAEGEYNVSAFRCLLHFPHDNTKGYGQNIVHSLFSIRSYGK